MALSADILRGYTDTIILRQLAGGDSYGYQINKRVAEISGGGLEMKEATLYTQPMPSAVFTQRFTRSRSFAPIFWLV